MTRTFKIGGAVAVLAVVFLVAIRPGFVRTTASEDADDVAIYQMLLSLDHLQSGQSLVLPDTTMSGKMLPLTADVEYLDRARRSLPKRIVDDFIRRNRTSSAIPKLAAKSPLIYVPRAKIDRSQQNFWATFRKEYPKAESLVEFARPGYNGDGTAALVHYRYWVPFPDGTTGGGDATFYLEKVAGHWTISRNILVIKS